MIAVVLNPTRNGTESVQDDSYDMQRWYINVARRTTGNMVIALNDA